MPERMMVTCPGCDGVVSVSPTGDEAEVRCLKCDEMVYTRSAEGGEWWANVPVADPTAEKPVVVPVAAEKVDVPEVVAPELPDVIQNSVSTPQTESSEAPKETSPPSATDWILGAGIASINGFLFGCLLFLLDKCGLRIALAIGPDLAFEILGFGSLGVFFFSLPIWKVWIHQRRVRSRSTRPAELLKYSWLPSITDWFQGVVFASICSVLWFFLVLPKFAPEIGVLALAEWNIINFWYFSTATVFIFCIPCWSLWLRQHYLEENHARNANRPEEFKTNS